MLDFNMILDGTLQPGQTPGLVGVALTTSRTSTNVIDFGSKADRGAGIQDYMEVHVMVTTPFTGGTSLQVAFQGSYDNSTWFDMVLSPLITAPATNLVKNARILRIAFPWDQLMSTPSAANPGIEFARINYTCVGPLTGGAIAAYISGTGDRAGLTVYPIGYNTSNI